MNPVRAQAIAELTAPGQPYELREQVINGRRLRTFVNAPASLRVLFESTASDLSCITYTGPETAARPPSPPEGVGSPGQAGSTQATEHWTFAEAWDAAARIGHVLVHDCGVQPGDRVAISARNYPEWMLAFNAAVSVGAVAVAMNAHWQADEMAYGLQDSGAKVLIADQERLDRVAACGDLPGLQVLALRPTKRLAPGVRNLADLVAAAGAVPMPPVAIQPDDPATILYTSGSTGHPKGVLSTHRNLVSALLSWELDRFIGEKVSGIVPPAPAVQPGTLLAVPLFHVTGLHASYLAGFRAQRRLVAMYRWDVEEAARLIDHHQLSSMIGPAAVTGDLLRLAQAGKYSLASLQVLGGGGAPRAPEQVRQIGKSFTQALPGTGWGMTETNAIGCGIGGQDYLDRPASSGRSAVVLDLRVIDDAGQPLPAGERGELLVRGTSLFQGYWNRPDANAQVFIPDPDGAWFRTGDVAYFDDDGFIFIVDRIKDLIIRGGENIGCGQVEAALLLHPQVHEAAVYGVPDERLGEEVGATVHGAPGIDVEQLRAFLARHLAGFEVPRYIQVSAEPLPRTPSGKVLKRQIRAAALEQLQPGPATGGA